MVSKLSKLIAWNLISVTITILFFPSTLESDGSVDWTEPKFPTECFFFDLRALGLSIVPNTRKYSRRIRAIRELTNLIKVSQLSQGLDSCIKQ